MPRELFKRWRAYFMVRDAEAWEIAGHVAAAAWNAVILTSDGPREWKERMVRDWASFVPPRRLLKRQKKTAKKPEQDVAALAAGLAAMFGPKV